MEKELKFKEKSSLSNDQDLETREEHLKVRHDELEAQEENSLKNEQNNIDRMTTKLKIQAALKQVEEDLKRGKTYWNVRRDLLTIIGFKGQL